MNDFFKGRRLLKSEVPLELHSVLAECEKSAGVIVTKEGLVFCQRCGSYHQKKDVQIGCVGDYYYCPECIQLGRVDTKTQLYYAEDGGELLIVNQAKHILSWAGMLTKAQEKISQFLVKQVISGAGALVHAVTGAGKTEMLFAAVYEGLKAGKRICIASPRVDVCRELFPRIQSAFSQTDMVLLHGEQEEAYRYTPLVIATTHQLLRFFKAFDVLIIDEVDAFPFVGNQMLAYGAKNAQKECCSLIYLTATPTKNLFAEMKAGRLAFSLLPARYHGYPLVVPQLSFTWNWQKLLAKGKVHRKIVQALKGQLVKKRQTMIFCPNIYQMKRLTLLLGKYFPDIAITSVYAGDKERAEKIMAFRAGTIRFLLTTTILERGVTVYGIDVFVLESNHRVFSESALVQIAGRSGRGGEDPFGNVIFFHSGQSRGMKKAVAQIKLMNRRAQEGGYLKDGVSLLPP